MPPLEICGMNRVVQGNVILGIYVQGNVVPGKSDQETFKEPHSSWQRCHEAGFLTLPHSTTGGKTVLNT